MSQGKRTLPHQHGVGSAWRFVECRHTVPPDAVRLLEAWHGDEVLEVKCPTEGVFRRVERILKNVPRGVVRRQ